MTKTFKKLPKKEKETGKEDPFELDLGLGKFNLGTIFKGVGKLMDLAEKLEASGGEMKREGEFTVKGAKDLKGVYGFSIRTGIGRDGSRRPIIQPFGNIKKTPKGEPVVEDSREPIVDVFEEGSRITVVAEMPGVSEGEITFKLKGDVLLLQAAGKNKYNKEVVLPFAVTEEGLERNYKNGILELRFQKAGVS